MQTPSVVSQAHRPTGKYFCSPTGVFPFIYLHIARQTSSHVTSIFYGREGDSPEPFEDPLDRLQFLESPSPGDDDYEPGADDYEPGEDDYEPGEDDYEPNEDKLDVDHVTLSSNGQKRACANSMDDNDKYERAKKIAKSKGRPKASDYADDVQEVLDSVIAHYKVDLLRFDSYLDRTHELAWSKTSLSVANKVCDLKIAHNGKLIKMVSLFAKLFRLCSYSTQITCCGSYLCGEIKTKVKPLVASVYGFEVPTNETIRARNRKLVEELKDEYAFLYKVPHVILYPFVCSTYYKL